MRRFRFRLESVRALKAHAETAAQTALAHELAVGAERTAALARADAALRSAQAATPPSSGQGLAARQAFVERRERERESAGIAVRAQEEVVAVRSDELTSATVERAALDKLRERRQAEHKLSTARIEEATLGELALSRRRQAHGGVV
jgi:flagellar FliJ protein